MLTALGVLLAVFGALLFLIGGVWFVINAFREHILWGLGVLFVPLVPLAFLIAEWPSARRPFFWQLWGLAFLLGAAALLNR